MGGQTALDQQLLKRMAIGDSLAFAQFYDRHSPRVFAALVRWMDQRSDAEDLLQETFWRAWCRAAKYDAARSTPEVWLFVIARSLALSHLRRHRRERPFGLAHAPVTMTDPLSALECDDSTRLVRQALTKLPQAQRSVLILAFYGGLTYDQVAQVLAIPLGTAKTRIRTSLRRLRELLPELEECKTDA